MGHIVNLSSYIKTKLAAIDGVDPRYVFEYENPELPGFPCLGVVLREWRGRYLTNSQHERTYIYTIRIYQDTAKTNMSAATAEDNLRQLADAIIEAFDADNALGENAIDVMPIGGRMGWVSDQPIRTIEIDVECRVVVNAS